MRLPDGGGGCLPFSRRGDSVKIRKWRTPAILAAAAISAGFAWGMKAAHADSAGILSETIPKLGEGLPLESPVTISADTVSFDEETGVALAEGNVEVGFGTRTIKADRIRYDMKSGEGEFVGRVHYEQEGDEFSFDRIVLNIKTELGAMYNGRIRIRTNNYQISSEVIEKTGKRSFFLRKGELTTCPCDPEPDWKFGIGRTEVTLDGYAFARDVTFRIRDIPVLWFPWAAFPVKLSRQSGFLLPSFSQSSSRGYSIQLPFYWAINRWSDATITLDAMTKRGFRPEAEYRFVLNSASEGTLRGTQFHDWETDDTRYRYYGENRFRYSEHFFTNARWDIPSDDEYYVDLVEEDILRTARHVPSRGFGAWKGSGDSQALSVDWVEDLQGTPDDNTVQRLPEYTVTILPRSLGKTGLAAGGEAQATYFYRRAGDQEVRGRGDAEISRAFTLYPSVFFTPFLSLDCLGSAPTKDETGTRTGGRVVPNAGATLELDFRKEFRGKGEWQLVHIVSPVVGFRWVPDVDQSDISVTDMWSRVGKQRQFFLSLYQRMLRVGKRNPSEVAFLELSWAFEAGDRNASQSPYVDPLSPLVRTLRDQIDLATGREERDDSRSSDVFGRFHVLPAPHWRLFGEILFDPSEGSLTKGWVGGEWRADERNRASLEYRNTRTLSEDVHAVAKFRPLRLVGLETSANYSLKNGELTEGEAAVTLYPRSECWSVGFVINRKTRPDETSFRLTFGLNGIGTVGL
jgi:LPS-assembly protein